MRVALFRIGWIYVRGALVIALVAFLAETIAGSAAEVSRWIGLNIADGEATEWRILVGIGGVLAAPWIVGRLTGSIMPRFQRDRGVQALMRWERHLTHELAPDQSRGYKVALLNWPSADVRTLVVVGSTFHDPDTGRELAPVFLPNTPNFSNGSLRVTPVDELSITDWDLRDLINYQLSFGSAIPPTTSGEDAAGS